MFRWVALVGPAPSDHDPGMGLAEPGTVGPLELRPGGVRHIEYVRLSTPSLSGVATFQSWPVVVEGIASGYNWWPALEAAIGDLNRLCALLTASFGRAWIIRQSPGMVEEDEPEFAIPEHGPFEQHYGSTELAHSDATLPVWLDRAWEVAVRDQLASDALSPHYEGMLIKDAHPSFALLAFVSAIEAVGQTRLPTERCNCCKQVTKNTQRFRQALRLGRVRGGSLGTHQDGVQPKVQDRPCREAPRSGGDPRKPQTLQLFRNGSVVLVRGRHCPAA